MYQITLPISDKFIVEFDKQYGQPDVENFMPTILREERFEKQRLAVQSHLAHTAQLSLVYFNNRVAYDLVTRRAKEISGDKDNPPAIRDISDIEYASIIRDLKVETPEIEVLIDELRKLREPSFERKNAKGEDESVSSTQLLEEEARAYLFAYHQKRRIEILANWIKYCQTASTFEFSNPDNIIY